MHRALQRLCGYSALRHFTSFTSLVTQFIPKIPVNTCSLNSVLGKEMRVWPYLPLLLLQLHRCQGDDHFARGNELYGMGRLEEAAAAYSSHLQHQPNDAGCLVNLASVYVDAGNLVLAKATYQQALKVEAHPAAQFNLALLLQDERKHEQAAELYTAVLVSEPHSFDATANLAACLHSMNRFDLAIDVYNRAIELALPLGDVTVLSTLYEHLGRALMQLPGDQDNLQKQIVQAFTTALAYDASNEVARHMLASQLLKGGEEDPPEAFVRHLFDDYADSFETSLAALAYSAPKLIAQRLEKAAFGRWGAVLDLGCGSGLMGELLRNSTSVLLGVDLSPKMLFIAEDKHIYDGLFEGDIVVFVEEAAALRRGEGNTTPIRRKLSGGAVLEVEQLGTLGLDWTAIDEPLLVVAADVLVYVGSLTPLLSAIALLLRRGDAIAFTVEALLSDEGEGWLLQRSGRFAHGEAYLRTVAGRAGLEVLALDRVEPRQERGRAIDGLLAVLALQ